MHPKLIIPLLLSSGALSQAEPILTSWFTENSTKLARVIQSGTLTTPVTTWPAPGVKNGNTGGAAQTLPAYADVQRIRHTLNAAKPADANATKTVTSENGAALSSPKRFYRVTRTGLSTFDP